MSAPEGIRPSWRATRSAEAVKLDFVRGSRHEKSHVAIVVTLVIGCVRMKRARPVKALALYLSSLLQAVVSSWVRLASRGSMTSAGFYGTEPCRYWVQSLPATCMCMS